jgi:L-ribulose-5-phosphate 4-epimerase
VEDTVLSIQKCAKPKGLLRLTLRNKIGGEYAAVLLVPEFLQEQAIFLILRKEEITLQEIGELPISDPTFVEPVSFASQTEPEPAANRAGFFSSIADAVRRGPGRVIVKGQRRCRVIFKFFARSILLFFPARIALDYCHTRGCQVGGPSMGPSLDDLKRDLVTACKILANEHVIDAFGHISVRILETDRFLIPPFVSAALVEESDLLTLDLGGKVVEGNGAPNREIFIHSECYRSRPDIGSVCHTHSPMVKVFASLSEPLKPIENSASIFAPETPIYPRVGLIVTEELGREVAESLGDHRAVLMRGHGSTVVGPNLQQAVVTAIYLEETARLTYRARCIGTPIYFTDEEVGRLSDYVLAGNSFNRAWDYYAGRLSQRSD